MDRNINRAAVRNKPKSDSSAANVPKSCGKCSKTIRMRDGLYTLLCTATLGVVDANLKDVCIYYEERGESAELLFLGQPG
jgi:hypothetical protein